MNSKTSTVSGVRVFSSKPLPYFNSASGYSESKLASSLRSVFVPKIRKRLPGHHLRGFQHSFIVKYVGAQKKNYPWFLRTDIERFYPSIDHRTLLINVQLAYKYLLSLDYVPASFRKKYVTSIAQWCNDQPLTRGVPLGSPLSSILAPVMLVPLWLLIKKMFDVPMLIYMDDILIFARTQDQVTEIYVFLQNYLDEQYTLRLNFSKTVTGRFSRDSVDFCGWEFTGGYARISPAKVSGFLERLHNEHMRCNSKPLINYIKDMNRKIDGFGHYYKYGDVGKQFEALDIEVRKIIRRKLKIHIGQFASNHLIRSYGFRNLSDKLIRVPKRRREPQQGKECLRPNTIPCHVGQVHSQPKLPGKRDESEASLLYLEKINHKLTELTAIHRKLLSTMQEVLLP